MKNLAVTVILIALALVLGVFVGKNWPSSNSTEESVSTPSERKVLYWKAPMDPNFRRDQPGKSPMGMDLVPVYANDTSGAMTADDPGMVSISSAIMNNLGVRSEAVTFGPLSRQIETVGYLGYDEDAFYQVSTRVDGWIEKLVIKTAGDVVTRGQVLFELYSPEVVNAQEEFLLAVKSGNAVLRTASEKRLQALGVTRSQIKTLKTDRRVKQRIKVYAESDGVVVKIDVQEGTFVTPATRIMSITTLDQLWVLAEVFERQSAWVEKGQRVEVMLDYLQGESREGTVDYIYPELDAKTRTLRVRVRIDNEDGRLRPNMFARVTLFSSDSEPVIHIPAQALIRSGRADRVVLALGDGKFKSVAVRSGQESGDRVEIVSGLQRDDRVVTSAQFLIDSESNIDSALSRMNGNSQNFENDQGSGDAMEIEK